MGFRQKADVRTSDGTELGSLDRVVLDPHTQEVIAIVVHKGPAVSEDKVVPLDLIEPADDELVRLREDSLRAGARVVDRAGEPIDSVERVPTDPQANRATHLVVSRGLLLKERKGSSSPPPGSKAWAMKNVRVAVRSPQVEQLRPSKG